MLYPPWRSHGRATLTAPPSGEKAQPEEGGVHAGAVDVRDRTREVPLLFRTVFLFFTSLFALRRYILVQFTDVLQHQPFADALLFW